MTDIQTHRRIRVIDGGKAEPHFLLPVSELSRVERALRDANIEYWVDAITVSIGGGPEGTAIVLRRADDQVRAQQVLDQLQ